MRHCCSVGKKKNKCVELFICASCRDFPRAQKGVPFIIDGWGDESHPDIRMQGERDVPGRR